MTQRSIMWEYEWNTLAWLLLVNKKKKKTDENKKD